MHRSLKLEEARRLARENIKDIIACGFDPDMTFIFSDIDHMGAGGSEGSAFYCNCLRIMRCRAADARRQSMNSLKNATQVCLNTYLFDDYSQAWLLASTASNVMIHKFKWTFRFAA